MLNAGDSGDSVRSDRVGDLLRQVAGGDLHGLDGVLTVLAQPSEREAAVLAFTGCHLVLADVDPAWIRSQLPDGDLSAPLNPPFLTALTALTGRRVNNVDLLAVAAHLPGAAPLPLDEQVGHAHPRVARALRYRDDVRVWTVEGGMVLLGRGLAGRWEVAVEVDDTHRGRGLGRTLARSARHLVPPDEPLWAQIAPGNAASVRAFLAAGFTPVGAEALLVTP